MRHKILHFSSWLTLWIDKNTNTYMIGIANCKIKWQTPISLVVLFMWVFVKMFIHLQSIDLKITVTTHEITLLCLWTFTCCFSEPTGMWPSKALNVFLIDVFSVLYGCMVCQCRRLSYYLNILLSNWSSTCLPLNTYYSHYVNKFSVHYCNEFVWPWQHEKTGLMCT